MSETRAEDVLRTLAARGLTIAVAEALTGGLVVADLISVPGASTVVRGGIVAYATDLKATLLGVDAGLLDAVGPIDGRVAEQMATGVRSRLGADVGVATTGVAGPDPQDGHPPGEVWWGIATSRGTRSGALALSGDRAEIRAEAVRRVWLELLGEFGE
jgi:nicotinamide-nucleotide amidase